MRHLNEFEEFNPDDFTEDALKDLHKMGFKKKFAYGKDFGLGPELETAVEPGDKPILYMRSDMVYTLEAEGILDEVDNKEQKIYTVPPKMFGFEGCLGDLHPVDDFKYYRLIIKKENKGLKIKDIRIIASFIYDIQAKAKESGNFQVIV